MQEWNRMVDTQPLQGQKILAKMQNGSAAITNYCRFCWDHWKIVEWKPMPDGEKNA